MVVTAIDEDNAGKADGERRGCCLQRPVSQDLNGMLTSKGGLEGGEGEPWGDLEEEHSRPRAQCKGTVVGAHLGCSKKRKAEDLIV